MEKENNFLKIIKEICQELSISFKTLSKDYVIMLEKDNIKKFIIGYKFDLLTHAEGLIFDDKYAMYDLLNNLNISVVKHYIIYHENNLNSYAINCKGIKYLKKIYELCNHNLVIKINNGTCGIGIYKTNNLNTLIDIYNKLIDKNFSLCLCPFYDIEYEYRAIVLEGKIKLLYKKIKPVVIGDGVKSIKELLLDFNYEYFKNYDKENKDDVLIKGEVFEYDWKFNLSRGAISSSDISLYEKENIEKIVNDLKNKIKLSFCSVDVIKTKDNKFYVMEINSGVMMENFIVQHENGYDLAKNIYKEAILKIFN